MAYNIIKKVEVNNTSNKYLDLIRYAILEKDNEYYLQLKLKNKSSYTITKFTIHYYDGEDQKEYNVENTSVAANTEFFDKNLIKLNTTEFSFIIFSNIKGRVEKVEVKEEARTAEVKEEVRVVEVKEEARTTEVKATVDEKVEAVAKVEAKPQVEITNDVIVHRIEKPRNEVKKEDKENKKAKSMHALKLIAISLIMLCIYPVIDICFNNGMDIFMYGTTFTIILYIINVIGFFGGIGLLIYSIVKEHKSKQETIYHWKHIIHYMFVVAVLIISAMACANLSFYTFGEFMPDINSGTRPSGTPTLPDAPSSSSNISSPYEPDFPSDEQELLGEIEYENLVYEVYSDGTARVIGCATDATRIEMIETIEYDGSYYIVTHISSYALRESNFEYIKLPNGIEVIEEYAFYNSNNLTTIELPYENNLKYIMNNAFNATNLQNINLEYAFNLEYIGDDAFTSRDIETIYIGDNVKYIGECCFAECQDVKFEVSSYNEIFENRGNSLYNKVTNTLIQFSQADLDSEGRFDLRNTKEVGKYAFAYCYDIIELRLYDVEVINHGAFFNCVSAERLYIDDTVKEMFNVFHLGQYSMSVYFKASGMDLPYGWTGTDYYCVGEIRTGVNF